MPNQIFNPVSSFGEGVDIGNALLNGKVLRAQKARQSQIQQERLELLNQGLLERYAQAEMNRDSANTRASDVLKAAEDRITAMRDESDKRDIRASDLLTEKQSEWQDKLADIATKLKDSEDRSKQQKEEFDKKWSQQGQEFLQKRNQEHTDLMLKYHQTEADKYEKELEKIPEDQQDTPAAIALKAHVANHRRLANVALTNPDAFQAPLPTSQPAPVVPNALLGGGATPPPAPAPALPTGAASPDGVANTNAAKRLIFDPSIGDFRQ